VVSRDELNASQLAELAALDRILAREPVDEEHLELAALVDSVRGGAPRMDPAYATRLDEQIGQRLTRDAARRRRFARPSLRQLSLAGGGMVAAAVALTIVISGGLLHGVFGGGTQPVRKTPSFSSAATHAPGIKAVTPAARAGVHSTLNRTVAPLGSSPVPQGTTSATTFSGPAGTSGSAAGPVYGQAGGPRLVARGSSLTLASPPAAMQGVANQIVAATERQGGVVESSNVEIQGPSSYASFALQVPSGRLGRLIGALSALASVRALTQNTHDITDGYNKETALLADRVAERAALLKQLAAATSAEQTANIQRKLSAIEQRISIEHHTIDALLGAGHNATLQVTLVAGAAAKHSKVVAGPLSRAFHDALHALEEILAIALIALAIVLPFALTALAVWWAAASLRQRARDRAISAA
jgi:hypothetical protein